MKSTSFRTIFSTKSVLLQAQSKDVYISHLPVEIDSIRAEFNYFLVFSLLEVLITPETA